MASAIITSEIDENYPVAGVDNDSQGFRDNFNNIKTALNVAKNEISDLQDGVARVDGNNNFNGNQIIEAALLKTTQVTNELNNNIPITTSQTISWNGGQVFSIIVNANLTLTFDDFPAENYAVMRVFLYSFENNARTITLASQGGTVKYSTGFPSPLTATSSDNPVMLEVSTFDGGVTLFVRYLGIFA